MDVHDGLYRIAYKFVAKRLFSRPIYSIFLRAFKKQVSWYSFLCTPFFFCKTNIFMIILFQNT